MPRPATDAELAELSAEECRLLLGLAAVGRIAFVVEGRPVVFPVNYRLLSLELGLWVVIRTRPGRLIDGAPAQVAFEIDGVNHDNHAGWSVLVRGVLQRLDRNEIELFSRRSDPEPWPQEGRTSWLAIKAQTITGRKLLRREDAWALPADAHI